MDMEELYIDYREAVRHKHRNADYVAFDLHRCRGLQTLHRNILDRNLQPTAAAYIEHLPVIREVFSADIPQCVTEHHLERYLRPLMEKVINPCVFNNRVGRGLDKALNHLVSDIYEVSGGLTEDCWLCVSDLSGYFPNANQDRSFSILGKLVDESSLDPDTKDELTYMLMKSIYFNASKAELRSPVEDWNLLPANKSLRHKPEGIGAAAGKLIMQIAMTYYHDEVIKWLMGLGVHVTVYGDDFAFVVKDKERFLNLIMPEFRERMAGIGCVVHPHKFYCQHYTKGVRFCSQVVKMQRVYTGNRTIRNFHRKIGYWNRHFSYRNMWKMLSSLNSYFGIMRNRNSYGLIRDGEERLSSKWRRCVGIGKGNILRAKAGYGYNDILHKQYKIKRNGQSGKNQRLAVKAA